MCTFEIVIGESADADVTPPVIICPGNVEGKVPFGSRRGLITWDEPTATDDSGEAIFFVGSRSLGDSFPIGPTEVTYTAYDTNNNAATCSFIITVTASADFCKSTSTPCQNMGTCTNGINSYTCQCLEGYEGTHCGDNTDECASNPCLNGSTCNDGVNSYACQCLAGYDGGQCEMVLITVILDPASIPQQEGVELSAMAEFGPITVRISSPSMNETVMVRISDGEVSINGGATQQRLLP